MSRQTQWPEALRIERPVPPSPAGTRLRRLIAITAATMVVVEAVNLAAAHQVGYALFIRTAWAVVRVIGWLVLMRAVRFGRAGARPFGLILAATTVFAVARLAEPRQGSLAFPIAVIVGIVCLTGLCAGVVWMLYRSPSVGLHLSGRQVRRHVPASVLTVRVAVLAYTALVTVPFAVAVGSLFHASERRHSLAVTGILLLVWLTLIIVVAATVPLASFFVLFGHAWARWAVGLVSVVVLFAQPTLCWAVNGMDGLLRDGVPLIITVLVGLVALYRSRGLPTWVRPTTGTAPVETGPHGAS